MDPSNVFNDLQGVTQEYEDLFKESSSEKHLRQPRLPSKSPPKKSIITFLKIWPQAMENQKRDPEVEGQ